MSYYWENIVLKRSCMKITIKDSHEGDIELESDLLILYSYHGKDKEIVRQVLIEKNNLDDISVNGFTSFIIECNNDLNKSLKEFSSTLYPLTNSKNIIN